jgi:hypothetical protein
MLKFFRKKPTIPAFPTLQQSLLKNKYFVRVCRWQWLNNEMITVTDIHAPRVITMDPWPQLIFLEAQGDKTVSEFIYYLAGQYTSKIPSELDSTVLYEINSLLGEGIIELRDGKTTLPDDILKPQ